MRVQALAARLAVKRFGKRIICGLTRAGEVNGYTALGSPQIPVSREVSSLPLFARVALG